MENLSFKNGVDSYLSVLIIGLNGVLAITAIGTLLALVGLI
ncbi:hypothetical protein MTsPCn9_25230 [Croceitalea sp. MTPC9]|nr:hypothetical protein MTsPCn6_29300 [Croceitalea sp. MTPC6]GMN17585.1 hypothetical protein MTsPCn9_25230 [Croceitalea sp. MTPC9]